MNESDYKLLRTAAKTAMRYCGVDNIMGMEEDDVTNEIAIKLLESGKSVGDYKFASLVWLCRRWILDKTLRNQVYLRQSYIEDGWDVVIDDEDIDMDEVKRRFDVLPSRKKAGIRHSITSYETQGSMMSDVFHEISGIINS